MFEQPSTQAAKEMLDFMRRVAENNREATFSDAIVTAEFNLPLIEAEAAAKERERIAAAVRTLPEPTLGLKGVVSRAAVLALLEGDDAS